jgi:hypothetical protein
MKIQAGGKEHAVGDPHCAACDAPKTERPEQHPQMCGANGCTGLRHAEALGNEREGWAFKYCCDKCGDPA